MRVKSVFVLILCGVVSLYTLADNAVKKSTSGICHDTNSTYYERTKNFEAFDSVADCINSGGRAVKNFAGNKVASDNKSKTSSYGTIKYNRKTWKHWSDFDGDCQDTRAEVLINQSQTPVIFDGGILKRCRVTAGKWYDPYSDMYYYNDDDLDIDHIVPLAYSHAHGGSSWDSETKEKFANDYENLLAVKNTLNRQKSAKGPAEWMPPNQQYRCEYLEKFDGIVLKYKLTYFTSEERVINRMKSACGLN